MMIAITINLAVRSLPICIVVQAGHGLTGAVDLRLLSLYVS